MMPEPVRWRDWLWLLWPPAWWRIFSSAKDFSAGGVLASPALNAAGLHVRRKALAHALCERRRARMRAKLPEDLVRQWDDHGCIRIDNFLAAAQWTSVCEELAVAALHMTEMAQPPALTRRANLDAQTCRDRYPALLQLITDDRLLQLLQYAAGYRGRPVVAVQCIHSDAQGGGLPADPQTDWHTDTFHSTAKAWLFLHAVAADDGPFSYWKGSHRLNAARRQWEQRQSMEAASHPDRMHARGSWRASEADLAAMGYGQPMVAAVPGNTLVIADTGGFHRRVPSAHATVRVEVYFSLRRNPFLAGLVPGVLDLPLIRDRWALWLFAWYRWLHGRGLPSWTPRESAGLNAPERSALSRGPSLHSGAR